MLFNSVRRKCLFSIGFTCNEEIEKISRLKSRGEFSMKLQQLSLPIKNKILQQYWEQTDAVTPFFEYGVTDESYEKRLAYLKTKQYKREQLAAAIESYMRPFGISSRAASYIEQLKKDAVVVVGGQQAGVLTGPLYSVHKAISVILLAKEQAEKLQHPVVPLFWIAGEDHDIEEINHTYTVVKSEVKKRGYSERSKRKTMASTTALNKEAMESFVRTVFADYGETAYTARLLASVLEAIQKSETFTQFFTALMNDLFKTHGLLMIDAADSSFRAMQSDYFEQIILHTEEIAAHVVATEQKFAQAGFGTPIEATANNANLFIVQDGERFLLARDGEKFTHVAANIRLTKEQLLEIAKKHPEQLSNNVVTRPMMQEMTIPVLAFVGGPGELAYWATLKDAFATLNLQMPIFTPRMNITLVSRQIQPLLVEKQFTFEDIYSGEVEKQKQQFIESLQDDEVKAEIEQTKQLIAGQYERLVEQVDKLALPLEKVLTKNEQFHFTQLDFLQAKIEQQLLLKHDIAIRQYTLLQSQLLPNEGFQERLFNPYQYLNEYGETLIDDLLQLPFALNPRHQLVIL